MSTTPTYSHKLSPLPSDLLDGVPVVSARIIPYRHDHTYDILPASDTGTYVAAGRLIGSTLH